MARPDSLNGGARVTDEERIRAVSELRKASTGEYRHVDALDVIAGSVGVDADGKFDNEVEKETYAELADFIDRPTCRNTLPQNWGTFECSECGAQFEVCSVFMTASGNDDSEPIIPNYCPGCGARVVDDDD